MSALAIVDESDDTDVIRVTTARSGDCDALGSMRTGAASPSRSSFGSSHVDPPVHATRRRARRLEAQRHAPRLHVEHCTSVDDRPAASRPRALRSITSVSGASPLIGAMHRAGGIESSLTRSAARPRRSPAPRRGCRATRVSCRARREAHAHRADLRLRADDVPHDDSRASAAEHDATIALSRARRSVVASRSATAACVRDAIRRSDTAVAAATLRQRDAASCRPSSCAISARFALRAPVCRRRSTSSGSCRPCRSRTSPETR